MNSVVCAFIWQEAVASNTVRISSPGFTISNLKWHYLFRQDFLAANLVSFFASSVVKRKDGDTLDGAQSMACVPWQCPGSAELGGAVGQEPGNPPRAGQLELQVLLHVAFLAALFKRSLWAILDPLPVL